jgi:predicted AlkP superfamily phosphohydrolase/phosphomutase
VSIETSNRRVFIIGIDGGTLDVLLPLVEKGLLPTFARLMQESAWGTLRSSIPPVSPVAWASFMTGQNPAKHGILDFAVKLKDSDVVSPVSGNMLRGKTLWRLLSDEGKKVGVINVPVTFPPEPVNGFLVSGFPMPLDTHDYTYPPSLAAELQAQGWDLSDIAGQTTSKHELDDFVASLYRRHRDRIQATLWLMERYEWDLMMLHIFETDRIQHEILQYWLLWQAGQDGDLARRYGPELERFFQAVDGDIERLWQRLEELAPGSTLVLMSDHGFGPTYRAAHLYNWLRDTGLMQLKSTVSVRFKRVLATLGATPVNSYRLLPHQIRGQLRRDKDVTHLEKGGYATGPIKMAARMLRRTANRLLLSFDDVDWKQTRAYCMGYSGLVQIYVNLEGRDPHGSVSPQAYESTREDIIAALRAWVDPVDGQPVVSEIYRREEIYAGPYLEKAADVLALFRGGSNYISFAGPLFLSDRAIDERNYMQPDRANHRMNGLIMIRDERMAAGHRIHQAEIVDVAPTVLHLLGLPVPSTMDGTIIEEGFAPGWLQAHPPQIVQVDDIPVDEAEAFTAAEEASMLEMLKGLGYVS